MAHRGIPSRNPGKSTEGGEAGQGEDEASEDDNTESGHSRRQRDMEMTTRNLHLNSKVDNCDGVINRNGGDMTEISVPLSHSGKRMPQIEGGNLYRLRDRKVLLEDKKCLCAWALGTALLGTLLMILHAELCPFIYQPVSHFGHVTFRKIHFQLPTRLLKYNHANEFIKESITNTWLLKLFAVGFQFQ